MISLRHLCSDELRNIYFQPENEAGRDQSVTVDLHDMLDEADLERMGVPERENVPLESFEGFSQDLPAEDARTSTEGEKREGTDRDENEEVEDSTHASASNKDEDQWIVPAEICPDYDCNENGGQG